MPLPTWITDKSSVEVIETSADRKLKEQIKKTIEMEKSDPELSIPGARMFSDNSAVMIEVVEMQYEGSSLEYHGYT